MTLPGPPPSRIGTVIAWLLAALAGLTCLVRAMPNMGAPDRGVFVSTAERVLAGDRLYVDVWENKDPVFYYLMAAGRLVSPLADYAVELGWLAVTAWAAYALARRITATRAPAIAAASLALLALTGGAYIAGYTYLPGTALVLAAAALAADRRFLGAGILVGLLVFTKPMMLPLAAVAVLVWWWPTRPGQVGRAGRDATEALVGFAGALAAMVVILAVRGELGGWFAAQLDNVDYSQQRLRDTGQNPIIDHLSRVLGPPELAALTAVAVVAGVVLWWARGRDGTAVRDARILAVATLGTGAASIAVIAATGLGPWHNQLLQPTLVLGAVLAAVPLGWLLARPAGAVAALALVPLAAWVGGGAPSPDQYRDSVRFYRGSIGVLLQVPADARAILDLGATGGYARLGGEYDDGHAHGLRNWDLACPRFHQYFFQPRATLDEVLACVATAPVVLVAPTFEPRPAAMLTPDWNRFVQEGEALLAAHYDCVAHEGFRLCTRRPDGSASAAGTGDR